MIILCDHEGLYAMDSTLVTVSEAYPVFRIVCLSHNPKVVQPCLYAGIEIAKKDVQSTCKIPIYSIIIYHTTCNERNA